ncbi:MAG: hypothetical protein ACE5I2_14990, partial [Anaerolineae bacterium]
TPTHASIPLAGWQTATPAVSSPHSSGAPRRWIPIAVVSILIAGLLIIAGGYVWSQSNHRRSAPVDGRLRLVGAPEGEPLGRRWDLAPWKKKRVTIGGVGSDVPLTNSDRVPTPVTEIVGRRDGSRRAETLLRCPGTKGMILVNNRSVRDEQPLWDRDEIQIGDYVLRYENLDRRRPRAAGSHRSCVILNGAQRSEESL